MFPALEHPVPSSRRYTKQNEKQGLKFAMNKSDLFVDLAKEANLPLRKSEEIVNLVFETMSRSLIKGDRIEVRGFGSFVVKKYRGLHRSQSEDGGKDSGQ